MQAKVYTKNDLRLYLQESNKTIREIFYFDMIDYKINAFEESLFCGGVLLQSIDLSGNEIDMIDMSTSFIMNVMDVIILCKLVLCIVLMLLSLI